MIDIQLQIAKENLDKAITRRQKAIQALITHGSFEASKAVDRAVKKEDRARAELNRILNKIDAN